MSLQQFELESERVVSKVFAGDAIVINLKTGFYFGMEGATSAVWALVSGGASLSEILKLLKTQYPDQDITEQTLQSFVDDLLEAQLIKGTEAEAVAVASIEAEWPAIFEPLVLTSYDDVAEMVALDPPLPELDYGKEA